MNFKIIAVLDSLFGSFCLFLAELLSSGKRSLPEKADTITVLKFLGSGSLILAAPALYAIKVRHPHIRLILYTTVTLQAHAGMLQLFDEIILLSPGRPLNTFVTFLKLRRQLISRYAIIINLEYLSKMAIFFTVFLRGSFTISLCKKNYRSPDLCITAESADSMADMYDAAATALGCKTNAAAYADYLRNSQPAATQKQIIFAPFCSSLSLRRMWNPQKWSRLISMITTAFPEYTVALIGAPSDRMDAQKLIADSGAAEQIHNYCGEINFEQASLLIRKSSCFCGIDSAPLHMARLSAVPAVSLWGATDPLHLTRKFCGYPELIIAVRKKCSPCVHTRKKCPLADGCMDSIPVETVFEGIKNLLSGKINNQQIICLKTEERS